MKSSAAASGLIRDAVPERDASACLAIYSPYVLNSVVSFEEQLPTPEEFAERIRQAQAMHAWLVHEADGELAGYAYATAHRQRAAYRWAVDTSVYVASGRHRSGIGRALYGELLERMRRQGFQIACAGVTLPNDASVGLHEAMGFEPVGVYRRIGWKAGAWHDVGWWQLHLTQPNDGPPPEPVSWSDPPTRVGDSR